MGTEKLLNSLMEASARFIREAKFKVRGDGIEKNDCNNT